MPFVRFLCPSPPCALGAQWGSPDVGDPSHSWFSVDFPPQPDRLFCQRPPPQEGSGSLFRERLVLGASQHISPGSPSHPEASRPRAAQGRPLKKRNKEVAKQSHPLLPHVHAYARLLALPACGILRAGAVLPTLRRCSPSSGRPRGGLGSHRRDEVEPRLQLGPASPRSPQLEALRFPMSLLQCLLRPGVQDPDARSQSLVPFWWWHQGWAPWH